jgi:hypothetical protein
MEGVVGLLVVIGLFALIPLSFRALFALVDYMADEEKLEEIKNQRFEADRRRLDAMREESTGRVPMAPEDAGDQPQSPHNPNQESTVTCPHCGTENRACYTYCRNCLQSLSE